MLNARRVNLSCQVLVGQWHAPELGGPEMLILCADERLDRHFRQPLELLTSNLIPIELQAVLVSGGALA